MRIIGRQSVDRPAVCFYEINGYDENPDDPDPFNIYNHPSWQPLIEITRQKTDRIVMRSVPFKEAAPDPLADLTRIEIIERDDSRLTVKTIRADNRLLVERTRRDRQVNTTWTEEHLLKSVEDLQAYLSLPWPEFSGLPDISEVLRIEAELGDTGIVMIDTPDPLCQAAALFNMADYTVIALTEPALFRKLLDRFAQTLQPQTEAVAQALPGRLWRIYGPEYASPPYLPPRLFREYAVVYDRPMVAAIHRYGGYARLHCHGKIKAILDDIASTGCMGIDPIEPPPQGDVALKYVRDHYGDRLVLFGNLEASELEILPTSQFEAKIRTTLQEGTDRALGGFVLMPSSCPYGRQLPPQALQNYEKMVAVVEEGRF